MSVTSLGEISWSVIFYECHNRKKNLEELPWTCIFLCLQALLFLIILFIYLSLPEDMLINFFFRERKRGKEREILV